MLCTWTCRRQVSSLAEVGTLQLEFRVLSKHVGTTKYADVVSGTTATRRGALRHTGVGLQLDFIYDGRISGRNGAFRGLCLCVCVYVCPFVSVCVCVCLCVCVYACMRV